MKEKFRGVGIVRFYPDKLVFDEAEVPSVEKLSLMVIFPNQSLTHLSSWEVNGVADCSSYTCESSVVKSGKEKIFTIVCKPKKQKMIKPKEVPKEKEAPKEVAK